MYENKVSKSPVSCISLVCNVAIELVGVVIRIVVATVDVKPSKPAIGVVIGVVIVVLTVVVGLVEVVEWEFDEVMLDDEEYGLTAEIAVVEADLVDCSVVVDW